MYIFLLIHIFMGIWLFFFGSPKTNAVLFQQPAGIFGQALDAPLLQWSDFEAGPMDGWLHSYRIHGTGYVATLPEKSTASSHLKNLKMDGWNTK